MDHRRDGMHGSRVSLARACSFARRAAGAPVEPEAMTRAGPSLYDMLLGHIDGVALDDFDDNTLEILSVLENLKRILNTRAGTLKHLPNYGLPDLTNVYRNLPISAHQLKAQMEAT